MRLVRLPLQFARGSSLEHVLPWMFLDQWREPIIEYARCSASASSFAAISIENPWRMRPKGAIPETR
jgi:hypothetical protein